MAVFLNVGILWFTGSSQTTLGINLGLLYIYIRHRGKEKGIEKMCHHNLDIVQLKERCQKLHKETSSASQLLKDQRPGHCSPVLQASKGPTELIPLFRISDPLVFKAPPNGRQYMQWHANTLTKAMQSAPRHQILAQTIDGIETLFKAAQATVLNQQSLLKGPSAVKEDSSHSSTIKL